MPLSTAAASIFVSILTRVNRFSYSRNVFTDQSFWCSRHPVDGIQRPRRGATERSYEFESTDDIWGVLRRAASSRRLPDGCDRPRNRRVDVVEPKCNTSTGVSKCAPGFVHGGEPGKDWFGHAYPGAHDSCGFTSVSFRPTSATVARALERRVYLTNGHVQKQCFDDEATKKMSRGRWLQSTALECWANSFPLFFVTEAECLKHAQDGPVNDPAHVNVSGPDCTGRWCLTEVPYGRAPLPGIARLSASTHNVLPPPPYLVYARDAVLTLSVRTADEGYVPACAPYWTIHLGPRALHPQDVLMPSPGRGHVQQPPYTLKMDKLQELCRGAGTECPIQKHKKVVFLTQVFGMEYFHFVVEIWPRIAPFLPGLLADPDVVFHTVEHVPPAPGATTPGDAEKAHAVQAPFFELIGVPRSRLVSGVVFADEVVVPQVGYSHNPGLNLWPLLAVREEVERRNGVAGKPVDHASSPRPLELVVIVRDDGRRRDDKFFSAEYLSKLEAALPRHRVVPFKASNRTMMDCLACQIQVFQHADVVIGSHGAGLVHLMWMPSGATVIEMVPSAGVSMVYRELAFVFGLKYLPVQAFSSATAVADTVRFASSGQAPAADSRSLHGSK